MISHTRKRLNGFTLVELVLVVAIIGILATLALQNYNTTRVRAYNTNLKGSVQQYSQALDLYNTQNRTYLVTSSSNCVIGQNTTNPIANSYTLSGVGAGCVGLDGSGEGRMTRRGTTASPLNDFSIASSTGHFYSDISIADALVAQGFLKEVRTYPSVSSFTSNSPDFVLTLCDSEGREAADAASATNFAVYSQLKGVPSAPDTTKTSRLCGSLKSAHGWKTAVDWKTTADWVESN